jgi:hypothetical protein
MGLAAGEEDTSMFGIRRQGHQDRNVQVSATPLHQLMKDYELGEIDLIKIDIEGAEVMLSKDLEILSRRQQPCIHLSIHVPFFPQTGDKPAFAKSLEDFVVYDDRGDLLEHGQLRNRILCETMHPAWGTQHGNFFELLLLKPRRHDP